MQDWKDMLGAAFGVDPAAAQEAEPQQETPTDALTQQGRDMIDIVLEKKGRGGKQATIVTGLHIDDDSLKQLAAELKRHCGVGGSARGGEILIQGDARNKVLAMLCDKGFKARII